MKLLLGAFVIAHGLIHASFLSPAPPRTASGPEWPFEMSRSWLVTIVHVDPGLVRILGIALVAVTVGAFVLAGMSALGLAVPAAAWQPAVLAGSVVSVATLAIFFHPWLVLGFVIDAALLWAALLAGWTPVDIGG